MSPHYTSIRDGNTIAIPEASAPARLPARGLARGGQHGGAGRQSARVARRVSSRMPPPRYPSLYQVNTRVWLTALGQRLGRPATLDDIPGDDLDRLARAGLDWIWLLSVWQTGPAGQRVSRSHAEWRAEFQDTLPDLREEDIAGSGFAIAGYTVAPSLGGSEALGRIRAATASARPAPDARLRAQSHGARPSRGSKTHPDWYVAGHRGGPANRRRTTSASSTAEIFRLWPRSVHSPAGPTHCSSTTATRRRRRP